MVRKRIAWALVVVICAMVALPGCLTTSSKYKIAVDSANAWKNKAEELDRKNAQLSGQYVALQGSVNGMSSQLNDKTQEVTALEAELARARAESEASISRLHTDMERFAEGERGLLEWDGDANILRFESMLFDSGKADIKKEHEAVLRKVAEIIRTEGADFYVRIDGHTDNVPIKQPTTRQLFGTNWGLSGRRAAAVAAFLEKSGVSGDQVYIRGFASTRPLDSNKTSAGRQKNRRVEVTFVPRDTTATTVTSAAR